MDYFISDRWLSTDDLRDDFPLRFMSTSAVVYEVLRTYNSLPFALKRHYQRLKLSAGLFRMTIPVSYSQLVKLVSEGIDRNRQKIQGREMRIRISLFEEAEGVSSLILLFQELPEVSRDIYELGVRVGISPHIRPSAAIVNPVIKTPGLPWNVLTRRCLGENYDMIMLNELGNVAEGSFSTLFLVKDESLITPDIKSGVLPGITRQIVIKLARSMEIPIEERNVKSWELFAAEEAFLTHTSAGIVPIRRILDHVLIEDFTDGLTRLLLDNLEGFIMSDEECWVGVDQ